MKLQGPILVGIDFSAASDQALRQGIDLANGLGANLIVCHIVPELDTVNILFPQFANRNVFKHAIERERQRSDGPRAKKEALSPGNAALLKRL